MQPAISSSSSPAPVQEPAAQQPTPAAVPFIARDPYERIPAKWLHQGGIPAADATAYDRQALVAKLAEKFVPIDLDYPGLRIVNFDPAIFTIEGFMRPEECSSWQQHALESGELLARSGTKSHWYSITKVVRLAAGCRQNASWAAIAKQASSSTIVCQWQSNVCQPLIMQQLQGLSGFAPVAAHH